MEKRMKEFKNHKMGTVKNYKELLNRAVKLYPESVAFEYKKDPTDKNPEYIKHTFKEYKQEVTELGNALLKMGLKGKKIALIGNNRYEWCTSYMSVTCGGMIIVPLDKALPESEINSLITRSKADAVIFDNKYVDIFNKIKKDRKTDLKYYICMDKIDDNETLYYQDLVAEGKEIMQNDYNEFDNIEIKNDEMTIMLFTSGTTSAAKAVMLSQYNVCANINAMPHFVLMYNTDTLLSFLTMHLNF